MQQNAHECVRMRKNAPDCGITHTYTREAERTQGQTWTDMGWTGCEAVHSSTPGLGHDRSLVRRNLGANALADSSTTEYGQHRIGHIGSRS